MPIKAAAILFVYVIAALVVYAPHAAQSASLETPAQHCPSITVAIDIGHSLKRPGTRSARGISEYSFNLQQAAALIKSARRDFPGIDAFIINKSGQNISLRRRAALAHKAGARIFISVHHDSAQKRYLRPWLFNGKKLDHTPSISGFSLFISPRQQNQHSHQLARLIASQFKKSGRKPSDHHAESIPGERRLLLDRNLGIYAAPFGVLVRSSIPAVLVEFGVIRNKREETELAEPSMRNTLATALLEAIVAFCRNNSMECGC